MTSRITIAFLLALLALLAWAQPPTPDRPEIKQIYSGTLTLKRPTETRVSVAIYLVIVRAGQAVPAIDLPSRGTMTAQLRTGSLASIIGGKRQDRKEGEFWTIPAGASLGLATEMDTAVVQLTVISEN